MKKPRPDKKLAVLGPDKAEQLWDWMRTPGMSYAAIRELVSKEWGLSVSIRALSEWWEERASEEAQERVLRATRVANDVGDKATELLPKVSSALKAQLTQAAFELALSGGDVKRIQTIMSVVSRMDDQKLMGEQLRLDRERFEFNAAKAALKCLPELRAIAADESLDDQAKLDAARKKLFGEVPS